MKNLTLLLITVFVGMTAAQVKYVAVVETEVDAHSGASTKLTKAEVRQITAELRREAVNNLLPRDKYNIMTSETVIAQGGAVLEECAEENCVISLGSKIGADYIVRGIISKFQTKLTLTVEMYETENGNLVASSDPVRSEKPAELLEMATAASANMYRTFANAQRSYIITATVNPPNGGSVSRNPNQTYYTPGTIASVTAVPANGYEFTGWSGSLTSTKATLTGPMNRDLTLTANFKYILQTHTLTTAAFPSNGGIITRNPDKEAYAADEEVSVTATAHSGYTFTGWTVTGAETSRAPRLTVTMNGNKTVTANFYRQSVTPTAAPRPDAGNHPAKKHTFAAVSLDVIGAGILLYGFNRESNVKDNVDAGLYAAAEKSVKQRNIAYTVGSIILLSGVTVHIIF